MIRKSIGRFLFVTILPFHDSADFFRRGKVAAASEFFAPRKEMKRLYCEDTKEEKQKVAIGSRSGIELVEPPPLFPFSSFVSFASFVVPPLSPASPTTRTPLIPGSEEFFGSANRIVK